MISVIESLKKALYRVSTEEYDIIIATLLVIQRTVVVRSSSLSLGRHPFFPHSLRPLSRGRFFADNDQIIPSKRTWFYLNKNFSEKPSD